MPRQKDRYSNRNGQFPIHYENGSIRVFTNPSGELFVEQVVSIRGVGKALGAVIRFSSDTRDGLHFTTSERVEPEIVGNTISWHISHRR